ncbi:MAG: hypothetical protein ACK559_33120, partial [bacterium]
MMPAWDRTPERLIWIRIEVSASAAAEFSIGPACQPRMPACAISSMTLSRAAFLLPATSTSHSISTSCCSRCAAMFWKADTTMTSSPSRLCARLPALPSGGSCT